MCRWLVYQGPPIAMSTILLDPGHSLLHQSLGAKEIEWPTNGDGFGIGWYSDNEIPGRLRDVLPIWNDENLLSIAPRINTPLFFAHIRKATEGGIQRTNCHPFAHGRWLFQHNGGIPEFDRLKQRLYSMIAPELFGELGGSTDSECMFLLALTHGMESDPEKGLSGMIRDVERVRTEAGVEDPFTCTVCTSDGQRTWAVRYASHDEPRTLYYSTHRDALCDFDHCSTVLPAGAAVIASEPLGSVGDAWTRVEPSSMLMLGPDGVTTKPLALD